MSDHKDAFENQPAGQYLPDTVEGPTLDERDNLSANRETALGPDDRSRGEEERSNVWQEVIEEDLS